MRKIVFILIIIIFMTGLGFGQVPKVITPRDSGQRLIKQKMEMLGFQIGNVRKVNSEYLVPVVAFSSKTGALILQGSFKPFTAKVTILDSGRNIMRKPSSNEAKTKVTSNKEAQVKAVNPKSEAVGGGSQSSGKSSAKTKVGRNPGSEVMGVEPSPFVVFNKQQLMDLNFVINLSVRIQGIKFQ